MLANIMACAGAIEVQPDRLPPLNADEGFVVLTAYSEYAETALSLGSRESLWFRYELEAPEGSLALEVVRLPAGRYYWSRIHAGRSWWWIRVQDHYMHEQAEFVVEAGKTTIPNTVYLFNEFATVNAEAPPVLSIRNRASLVVDALASSYPSFLEMLPLSYGGQYADPFLQFFVDERRADTRAAP